MRVELSGTVKYYNAGFITHLAEMILPTVSGLAYSCQYTPLYCYWMGTTKLRKRAWVV
jgi:hypothetical protein